MRIKRIQRRLDERFHGAVRVERLSHAIRLTGTVGDWTQVVEAGQLAARPGARLHVVNELLARDGAAPQPVRMPMLRDRALEGRHCDVLIIGGGVIGCAIARELTRSSLDVLLVEKEYDLALHASSRNDGMIHPGIDLAPGLLKKRLNTRGNRLYDRVCAELSVPFERTGQSLCFEDIRMLPLLYLFKPYWLLTGVGRTQVLTGKALRCMEPGVSAAVGCAVRFFRTGAVCPYSLAIAYMENAVQNGAALSLDTAVLGMRVENGRIGSVETNRGTVYPKLVVNAAGVFAEEIAAMAQDRFFSIHPRRGTSAILDKKARRHVVAAYSLMGTHSRAVHTKGGGVVGTVDGNVLVGPDAHETPAREDFSTDAESIRSTFERHRRVAPWLTQADIITYFTGVRAATYEEDFIVERGRRTANLLHAAGIQSPGLTAAPAIAERIARLALRTLKAQGLAVRRNPAFDPIRPPIPHPPSLSEAERAALIRRDPDYGQIVCRCEQVSRGEILAALRRNVPCATVDGVKRRVRPGMGRCQGGFCGPLVLGIIAEECGLLPEQVRKAGPGSELLSGDKGALL